MMMMHSCYRVLTVPILCCVVLSGCGGDRPELVPRVTTVPVTGKILVDGNPEPQIAVTAVHSDGSKSDAVVSSSGFTDGEGTFNISTYETGDGVPPGEYKLLVIWGSRKLNGQYSGDKFNGKYADPSTSEIELNVSESDGPVDMGTIELAMDAEE